MQQKYIYRFLVVALVMLLGGLVSKEASAQGQVKSIMFTGRVVGVKGTKNWGKPIY